MSSLLQYRSLVRAGPGSRPAIVGAVTCGVLLLSAGTAQANHMRMADGTLCPHAAGTDPAPPGSTPVVDRPASSTPIGAAPTAAPKPAARPAVRPATKAPAQRPAAQSQAQRPASSQTQAQRPAAASQPVATRTVVATQAPRQAPVARPSVTRQPSAKRSRRAVSRPVVKPVAPTVVHGVPAERPGAYALTAVDRPDSATSVPTTLPAGLLGLGGILVAGLIAVRSRRRRPMAPVEDAVEAELQEMIRQVQTRAAQAPAGPDEREVLETR